MSGETLDTESTQLLQPPIVIIVVSVKVEGPVTHIYVVKILLDLYVPSS